MDHPRVRRLLRHLPKLRLAEHAAPARWYLDNQGMPIVVTPSGAALEPRCELVIGGAPHALTLRGEASCARLDDEGDARDRRFLAALCPGGRRWRLTLPDCLVALAHETCCALHVECFAALIGANVFAEDVETRIVEHMNADHGDALRAYCRAAHLPSGAAAPVMLGIDADGFDLGLAHGLARLEFEQPLSTAQDARQALVAMAQRARD